LEDYDSVSDCVLSAAGRHGCGSNPVKKRASLDAEITALSHDEGSTLNIAVKITNNSEARVFILLFGEPSAFNDAGAITAL
jgi:hypothetical protein